MEVVNKQLIVENREIRDAIKISEQLKLSSKSSWEYLLRGMDITNVETIVVMLHRQQTNIEKRILNDLVNMIPRAELEFRKY